MKKRLIGALLLGAFMVSATSMFVSCKDYDDDVQNLQNQINNLDGTVKSSITTLQSTMTVLDAAYKSGDDAVLAAALQNVADAKAALEASLASKNEVNALEVAVIKAQAGVDQALKLLEEKADKSEVTAVKNDLSNVQGNLATMQTDLAKVQSDLSTVQKDLQTAAASIESIQKDVKSALAELSELTTALSGQKAALETVTQDVAGVTSDITDLQARAAELERQVAILAGTDPTQPTDLSGVNAELASLRQMVLDLSAQISNQPGSEFNTIVIALSKALRSLVFIPHLYLDGIESIEYPWVGDTILRKTSVRTDWKDLSHHGNDAKDLQDIQNELYDYVPNTLGRYYDFNAKQIKEGFGKETNKAFNSGNKEWIYGPVWPVEYHLNPSTALVDYANDAPSFNVLEPDVVYYNTRAKASDLNITSPEKYEYYDQDVNVFGAANGVLTVGLKIAKPNNLSPWPTDETINPNGNVDSNESYPANQAGNNQPFAGDKTDESYGADSWYGFAKYNKNKNKYNSDNTIALQMHKTDDEGGVITSDYALIVPTRVQLEGLIWYKQPDYAEPNMPGYNYGPNVDNNPNNNRIGDEEGWAVDEDENCTTKRIHIWDSPEEALADPDGAALELFIHSQVDLTKYLGVHYLKENLKKREVAPGVYNPHAYDIGTWKYGDEKAFGLHYEFEFVDYENSTNKTHDSRYASFTEWTEGMNEGDVVTGWNTTTS